MPYACLRNRWLASAVLLLSLSPWLCMQAKPTSDAQTISPEDLVKVWQAGNGPKPIVIQVGFRTLYDQEHIPGAIYVGPASTEAGLQQLRQSVGQIPKDKWIVLYCGCCPWSHCPNVKPAAALLSKMGFSNIKLLYIAGNFGSDWVSKGFPATSSH
jgi:thiosulfate/3-mercaptopyruvate sulfurtransferase